MNKILIATSSFGVEDSKPLDELRRAGFDVTLNPHGRKLTKDETVALLEPMVGVIAGTEAYTAEVLAKVPKLKVISRCGAGIDGIDIAYLKSRNIALLNTPDVHVAAVAELALAGLLSLSRRISHSHFLMKTGKWQKVMGVNLSGKTVGIIGYGKVGRLLRELLRGFGCKIVVFDPFMKEVVSDGVEVLPTLEELLVKADVVSLHIPYSEETKNFLSADAFNKMKDNVMILNTSRGGLIDEKALFDFLKGHPAAGAYIDVFETEPYAGELTSLPNVVLTPHVGTFTRETRVQMEYESAMNLIKYLRENG